MSTENNTGITWTFEDSVYFLRDDEACGICDYERHSLFRLVLNNNGRHILRSMPDSRRISIWSGPLDKTLPRIHKSVRQDRVNRGRRDIDPTTVFRDERGQA